MTTQFYHPLASTTAKANNSSKHSIQLDANGAVSDLIDIDPPEKPTGFLRHLASLVQVLMPGQTAKITVATVEITGVAQSQTTPQVSRKAPARLVSSGSFSEYEPICRDMVVRVLRRAAKNGKLRNCEWPAYASVDDRRLPDGTTMVILIDDDTGLKHGWTVNPQTHKPHYLGWVNE